ncbi:hypothetical protein GCM10010156_03420 [Planobispora rosea]|uniref:Uncharacterized protein n=3 Tax=Planobispora rosea TaxID=35762 RepID=A0A8J3WAI5_PLARO|nr:Clp protease N-terminal domain-containing protein [Planobispora rosea]GGS47969.1 hypothetical protein GCM10010156_03420 [Planobispora rosea]GIH82145.1 hypothetical protein Pro02_05530 [Planobispora rosea]
MFERFTDRARRVVVLAQEEARLINHNYIGTEHLLLGLIHEDEGVAAQALKSMDISLARVRQRVEEIIGQGRSAPSGHIPFTPRAKKVLELSLREALQLGHNYIGTEHILLGLIHEGEGVAAQVLVQLGADLNRVRQQVVQLLHGHRGRRPAAAGGSGKTVSPTLPVFLDRFGHDLTYAARKGRLEPVVGREPEIRRAMQTLLLLRRNRPLIVGEPGSGKTALVRGIAQAMTAEDAPPGLRAATVHLLDVNVITHEVRDREDLQVWVDSLAEEFDGMRNLVLALDDALTPIRSLPVPGGVLSLLWPAIERSGIRVIATATPEDHRRYEAEEPVISRAFRAIPLAELSAGHTARVLAAARAGYEEHHSVTIGPDIVAAVTERAGTISRGQVLPGGALDLLDHACAQAVMRGRAGSAEPVLLNEKLEEKIEKIRREKEAALDEQDFEKAAKLRDQEKTVLRRMSRRGRKEDGTVVPVTLGDVEEALALLGPPYRPRGGEAGTAGRDGEGRSEPPESG